VQGAVVQPPQPRDRAPGDRLRRAEAAGGPVAQAGQQVDQDRRANERPHRRPNKELLLLKHPPGRPLDQRLPLPAGPPHKAPAPRLLQAPNKAAPRLGPLRRPDQPPADPWEGALSLQGGGFGRARGGDFGGGPVGGQGGLGGLGDLGGGGLGGGGLGGLGALGGEGVWEGVWEGVGAVIG
jgi:hypothetical protein